MIGHKNKKSVCSFFESLMKVNRIMLIPRVLKQSNQTSERSAACRTSHRFSLILCFKKFSRSDASQKNQQYRAVLSLFLVVSNPQLQLLKNLCMHPLMRRKYLDNHSLHLMNLIFLWKSKHWITENLETK